MRLPDPRRSFAVLIGVSTYSSDELADLPAVDNNLSALGDALTDPVAGGLAPAHCVQVANPTDPRLLYRTLRQYARTAEDTLVVYFAGHGRTGPRNELHLCLSDTDPDELPVSTLPFELVRGIFGESPATNRVLILDCCFSGRAIADMAGSEGTFLGQIGIAGTYTLASAPANSVSLAPDGERYTAFTAEYLSLLRTGIPEGPPLLTFGDIYRRLLHTMTIRGLPLPQRRGTGTVDLLALTRNPAHLPSHTRPEPVETLGPIKAVEHVDHVEVSGRAPARPQNQPSTNNDGASTTAARRESYRDLSRAMNGLAEARRTPYRELAHAMNNLATTRRHAHSARSETRAPPGATYQSQGPRLAGRPTVLWTFVLLLVPVVGLIAGWSYLVVPVMLSGILGLVREARRGRRKVRLPPTLAIDGSGIRMRLQDSRTETVIAWEQITAAGIRRVNGALVLVTDWPDAPTEVTNLTGLRYDRRLGGHVVCRLHTVRADPARARVALAAHIGAGLTEAGPRSGGTDAATAGSRWARAHHTRAQLMLTGLLALVPIGVLVLAGTHLGTIGHWKAWMWVVGGVLLVTTPVLSLMLLGGDGEILVVDSGGVHRARYRWVFRLDTARVGWGYVASATVVTSDQLPPRLVIRTSAGPADGSVLTGQPYEPAVDGHVLCVLRHVGAPVEAVRAALAEYAPEPVRVSDGR